MNQFTTPWNPEPPSGTSSFGGWFGLGTGNYDLLGNLVPGATVLDSGPPVGSYLGGIEGEWYAPQLDPLLEAWAQEYGAFLAQQQQALQEAAQQQQWGAGFALGPNINAGVTVLLSTSGGPYEGATVGSSGYIHKARPPGSTPFQNFMSDMGNTWDIITGQAPPNQNFGPPTNFGGNNFLGTGMSGMGMVNNAGNAGVNAQTTAYGFGQAFRPIRPAPLLTRPPFNPAVHVPNLNLPGYRPVQGPPAYLAQPRPTVTPPTVTPPPTQLNVVYVHGVLVHMVPLTEPGAVELNMMIYQLAQTLGSQNALNNAYPPGSMAPRPTPPRPSPSPTPFSSWWDGSDEDESDAGNWLDYIMSTYYSTALVNGGMASNGNDAKIQ